MLRCHTLPGKVMLGYICLYSDALYYKFQELIICNARVGDLGEIFIQQKNFGCTIPVTHIHVMGKLCILRSSILIFILINLS